MITSKNANNSILLVMRDCTPILNQIDVALAAYKDIHIYTAKTAMEGIIKFKEYLPTLLIVENDLPDLSGMSVSSIIKGTEKSDMTTIYLIGASNLVQNAQADHYFPKDLAAHKDMFAMQLRTFFDRRFMSLQHSDELARAKMKQSEFLPDKIETNTFKVDHIYSPFGDLSGDGVDYWYGEDTDGLYGLLFDCTGHDIVSFLQVGEIRALLKRGCKFFQLGSISSLSEIMKNINEDLFALHGDDTISTAAVVFFFDFKKNTLHYCSAGIPSFYVSHKSEGMIKEIMMEGYLIGYEQDSIFEEHEISLDGVDKVIFSSDGFSELLIKNTETESGITAAKNDDVSAICVQLVS